MRVTFIGSGDPTESATCDVFGLSFVHGEPTDIGDAPAAVQAKLKGNPTFAVEGDPLDHDGDGRKGGSKTRKAAAQTEPEA